MPLQATSGAASYDGFGGGVAAVPNYIEDVFSTYLYTGNGASQTITNGIDLSGSGGLVWIKCRTPTNYNNWLSDTVRGNTKRSSSNTDGAESTLSTSITSFNSNGFSVGSNSNVNDNGANEKFVSWTFREQPKFFDVVTYTGNSTAGRTIPHNLGSVPGCIIIKCTDGPASTQPWEVYHRSTGNTQALFLNLTQGPDVGTQHWNNTSPTSTEFTLGGGAGVNNNTSTYIAYLFAHDAGGFGLTETENVISCGSYTGNGSSDGPVITLGYEPQWILWKAASGTTSDWQIMDTTRGLPVGAIGQVLFPNLTLTEDPGNFFALSATGFKVVGSGSNSNGSGNTYIYIAIRRGPMKVPTLGTSVFSLSQFSSSATNTGSSALTDLVIAKNPASAGKDVFAMNRLAGTLHLTTSTSNGESGTASQGAWDAMTGFRFTASANSYTGDFSSSAQIAWQFKRAPSFFDVVCYAGTGTSATQAHNLGVTPEWVICKDRTGATFPNWGLWSAGDGIVNHDISGLSLNSTAAAAYIDLGYSSRFTATTFRPDTVYDSTENSKNQSGHTYVAYLFATLAGVSKVGYYVGTGTLTTINCGFVAGARFVIIKNVSSTGGWYVWDSTRGMVSGTDPSLQLNSAAAESNADSVYAVTTGFQLLASPAVAVNTNLSKYIFLAIA